MYRTPFSFGPDGTTVIAWPEIISTGYCQWHMVAMDGRKKGEGYREKQWGVPEAHHGITRLYQSRSGAQGVGHIKGDEIVTLGTYRVKNGMAHNGIGEHGAEFMGGNARIYAPITRDGYNWEIDSDYPEMLVIRASDVPSIDYYMMAIRGMANAFELIEEYRKNPLDFKVRLGRNDNGWRIIEIPYIAAHSCKGEKITICADWLGHAGERSRLPSLVMFCKRHYDEGVFLTPEKLAYNHQDDDERPRNFRRWETALNLYEANRPVANRPPKGFYIYRKAENYFSAFKEFDPGAATQIGDWHYTGDRFFWRRNSPETFMCVAISEDWTNEYELKVPIEDWFREGAEEIKKRTFKGLDNKIILDAVYRAQESLTPEVLLGIMKNHPRIQVSVEDSLATGNCLPGTEAWMERYGYPSNFVQAIEFGTLANHDSIQEMLGDFNFRKVVIRRAMLDHIIPSVFNNSPPATIEIPVSVEIVKRPSHATPADPSADA